MSKQDSARTFYEAAQQQLIARIGQRDQALLLYLAAVGTLFGVVLGSDKIQNQVLLSIPYIAAGVTFLVVQHDMIIANIARYCVHELEPFLIEHDAGAPQWEKSETLRTCWQESLNFVRLSRILLLLGPPVIALVLNIGYFAKLLSLEFFLSLFGLLLVVLSLIKIIKVHRERVVIYKSYWSST